MKLILAPNFNTNHWTLNQQQCVPLGSVVILLGSYYARSVGVFTFPFCFFSPAFPSFSDSLTAEAGISLAWSPRFIVRWYILGCGSQQVIIEKYCWRVMAPVSILSTTCCYFPLTFEAHQSFKGNGRPPNPKFIC